MKSNLFIKILYMIMAMLMIIPALPDNYAYAATVAANDYATITTQYNTATSGSNSRYMRVQVFLDGAVKFDSGEGSSKLIRFSSNGPGTVTVAAKAGYGISDLYISNEGSADGSTTFVNETAFSINSGTGKYKTLKIYLSSRPQTIVDNGYVNVVSQGNTTNDGSNDSRTYMQLQVFVDDETVPIYDSGSSARFRFGNNGPGAVTVTAKDGYGISDLFRSDENKTTGNTVFENGTAFSISTGAGKYRTLRIYLKTVPQKIADNEFVSVETQNNTTNIGNNNVSKYMRVQVYLNGSSSAEYDSGSTASSMFRFGSPGPGVINVVPKSGYEITSMNRSNQNGTGGTEGFNNGTSFNINTADTAGYRTLKINIKSIPQTVIDNDYISVTTNPQAAGGNRTLSVEVYLRGVLQYTINRNYSANPGNTIVAAKGPYVISRMETRKGTSGSWSNFAGNSNIEIDSNGKTTLKVYLVTDNRIINNGYISVSTGTVPALSGKKTLTVQTYVSNSEVSLISNNYSANPGTPVITAKQGYAVTSMQINSESGSTAYSNYNGSAININDNANRTLRIYLTPIATDNEYVTVLTNSTPASGSKTVRIETYLGGVLKYAEEQDYSANPETTTVSPKAGYVAAKIDTRVGSLGSWNDFSGSISISNNTTLTLRIHLVENNLIVNDEFVTLSTTTSPSSSGDRTLITEIYVDGIFVKEIIPSKFGTAASISTTVSAKDGYIFENIETRQGTTGNWQTLTSNKNSLSISSGNSRTVRIYLKTPRALKINYYYDNVLQPDKSIINAAPENNVRLEMTKIEGKVFQKAKISDDSIDRNIDQVTKLISFTMPNKTVTIDYYYGTEGQVLLKKNAERIKDKTNEFYIDISVEGTPIIERKAADIVLVFDKSGSMNFELGRDSDAGANGTSRMDVLKQAANTFIDRVIPANEISMNRVSIVTYSGWDDNDKNYPNPKGRGLTWDDADIIQSFTSVNSIAKGSYTGLTPNGGTNSQAGFMKAQDAFSSDNGARNNIDRYVIYMTDGSAGFYYQDNGLTTGTASPTYDKPDAKAVSKTIEAAINLKNATNAKIYTVALISNDKGAVQALNPAIPNNYPEAYYKATTADDLTKIYSLLADKISEDIADRAVVTDTLPTGFTFNKNKLPENVTIDESGKLTWNIGNINTDEKKIRVETKYTGDKYGVAFANENCGIDYYHKNTPDVKTTKTFDVPMGALAPIINLPPQEVAYDTSLLINPIPSAYDSKKLNVGEDKGYRISDLQIFIEKRPSNGTIELTDEGKFIYTPKEGYVGDDSFKYKVVMHITNIYGEDPDGLVGEYFTITTVNINVNKKPTYILTVNYVYESGERFAQYVKELAPGEPYEVLSPEKRGYTAGTSKVKGTMPSGNLEVFVTYTKNYSKLKNYSMYPNKEKELKYTLMGTPKQDYKIVSGINYTFGFEFEAGENNAVFQIIESNKSGSAYGIKSFKLYAHNDDKSYDLISSSNNMEGLNWELIEAGKTYTVTYALRFIDEKGEGKVSLEVFNEYLSPLEGVFKKINITSTSMYSLQ